MSSQPEEGEIIEDEEEYMDDDEVEDQDDEVQMEDEDDFFPEDDEDAGMDIASLMTSLLATPDGDTVCSAIVNLCYQLETQNKILIKMLAKMQPPK